MGYFMENPIKIHDLGVSPYFWKLPLHFQGSFLLHQSLMIALFHQGAST